MRSRFLVGIAAAGLSLTACQGLKEALTAHVDVVARSGSQELSVERLGDLLGNAKIQVPVSKETATILADIWTGYQQLALAAAHNDSLTDKKSIDVALAPLLNMQKLQRFMDSVQKTFKIDSTGNEAAYNQAVGGMLGARHILIGFKNPSVPATQAEKDSAKKKADAIRAQATPANFADLAKKNSTEPNASQSGGMLGVFQRNGMIPAFSAAVAAIRPGEISQPVETMYGYHIIYRLPYSEAKADFERQYSQVAMRIADSTYMAKVSDEANIQVKDNAPATIKTVVKEQAKHKADRGTLATYKGGELTVADFLQWIEPMASQRIAERIPQVPDSVLKPFIKQMATQQVLLGKAEAAKIDIPAQDKLAMYNELSNVVTNIWGALGVDPKMLADSAKSTAEKERLAASRADSYLDRMMAGQAQPIQPPAPLKKLLDAKYETSVNAAGLDRAVERATKVRASADSARAANQPKSAIPLPGGAVPTRPPTDSQQPQPPAGTKKP